MSSSAQQQQAQAQQITTTYRAQPTARASSHEVASSRARSNAATSRTAATTTTTKPTRGGVKNYSSEEISALLDSICRVLPMGNEQWELVADLHSVNFAANSQPRTGNPSISQEARLAKEIKEAINVKARVTDADVSEFFGDDAAYEEDIEDEEAEQVDVGAAAAVPNTVSASVSGRRSSNVSVISSTNLSTAAAPTLNNKKTRGNIITAAIQQATEQTKSSFKQFIISKQMAEEFEWKQRRIEWDLLEQQHREEREEDRRRRAKELHEMRLKESRQQEQFNNLLQIAMTGMMAYMTASQQKKDDESKPPGKN